MLHPSIRESYLHSRITPDNIHEWTDRVIEEHCKRIGITKASLRARSGRNLAKKHGEVNLSLHRQILALYFDERLPVTKKTLGPKLGYQNHTNVIYNIGKAKRLLFEGKKEYLEEFDKLKAYADKITPELDFYQKKGGWFIFSKDEL
jgi:hypothetical protein